MLPLVRSPPPPSQVLISEPTCNPPPISLQQRGVSSAFFSFLRFFLYMYRLRDFFLLLSSSCWGPPPSWNSPPSNNAFFFLDFKIAGPLPLSSLVFLVPPPLEKISQSPPLTLLLFFFIRLRPPSVICFLFLFIGPELILTSALCTDAPPPFFPCCRVLFFR